MPDKEVSYEQVSYKKPMPTNKPTNHRWGHTDDVLRSQREKSLHKPNKWCMEMLPQVLR